MDVLEKRKQFGTRYLINESETFDYNAWDNVEWSEEQLQEAMSKIAEQKKFMVDVEKAGTLVDNPRIQWENFYGKHGGKFFMNRNWILTEFPELNTQNSLIVNNGIQVSEHSLQILEVGCGVGNTVFPLLNNTKSGHLFVHCCDYSSKAIEILKQNANYNEDVCHAFVWDISKKTTDEIPDESLDIILCIYVISAIPPGLHNKALQNLCRLLKPGGLLLFKDYGQYDLTQLRFKKDRMIDDNLYCRGDGTLVTYFTQEELDKLFTSCGLVRILNIVDRRLIMFMDDLYYSSAEIVRQALNKERSVRSAVYESSFKNKKQLLRICCETLKNRVYFDRLLAHNALKPLLKHPTYEHFSIVYVLLYEYLFGNGLRRCSKKLSGPITALKEVISQQAAEQKSASSDFLETPLTIERSCPRYARINTLKWPIEDAVKALSDDNWVVKDMLAEGSFDNFRKSIAKMESSEVFRDPHIGQLLVFHPCTDLHEYWMVEQGYLLLQDKASCISSILLNPAPGSEVIDVCAAPGMKTSHLSAIMKNEGRILAIDKATTRLENMRNILEKAGVTNVSLQCGDCLRLNTDDELHSKIEYALVDPPCSGSGIVKRLDSVVNSRGDISQSRLRSLSNLQAMILKHTLKLPSLKRVVYSTCSTYTEENEEVIQEDESLSKKFKLKRIFPSWELRGSADFSFGQKCMRAAPEITLTNGFFIAVLQRRKKK
ncbi:unnamed protein product [Enterobius vermicularis]|uniref:SAM_MT_RSMB_NOP domain-containing protein n=1 Tax=Enterobius vermicularis TaxID=51028 RepID=A0A0N4VG82_ENTVE|nr:unnamed protein product [Enterobius vermicularis]